MAEYEGETGGSIMGNFQTTSATNQVIWSTVSDAKVDTPNVRMGGSVKKNETGIHPRLYFKFIKHKLSIIEFRAFKSRMRKLEKMVDEYAEGGQEALSEECLKQYLIIAKESAMLACGIKLFITTEIVDKFRYKLRGCSLKITPLKNFGRVIPKKVVKKIKRCMEKKLFDGYEIFHLDDKAVKDTEKEREEKRRDPIVFGRILYSDKYYFIADWEDEFDKLRLEDIIRRLSLKKEKISIKKDPQIERK